MALVLLAVATVALAVRAIAAGGSATLYAQVAPRTAASLEAGATAAAVVGAGAGALALMSSTGSAVVALPLLALAPIAVLVTDLLPRALAQARLRVLPARLRALAYGSLSTLAAPLAALEAAAARLAGGRDVPAVPAVGQVLSELLHDERPGDEPALSSSRVIQRIFDFRDTRVRDVMIPLIHTFAVRDDAPIEEAVSLVVREKLSRVPVFHERMYNIVGIVHGLDLLGETRTGLPVARIMRAPAYVAEGKLAHQQLRMMQRRGINMAIVVDEYGGTVGILTVEDLLEEIVGEIEDEYDQREVLYETRADGSVRVEGMMKVARLNEVFPWRLPDGDYETIGGLVVAQLGRIPRPGARLKLPDLMVEVTRADERAVRQVIVRPMAAE